LSSWRSQTPLEWPGPGPGPGGAPARRIGPARRLLLTWLGNCLGLLIAAAIVSKISYGDDLGTLLLAGAILGVVNFALRPLVILLTLPAVVLSFGVALLLVNALMLWVTSKIVDGLHVGGFFSTLAGAALISLANLALRPWRGPRGPSVRGVALWWLARRWLTRRRRAFRR
jgi:putative membrane protein